MCGRFVSSSPPDVVARYFDVDVIAEQVLERGPNWNTAPTTDVFVVYEDGAARRLDSFRWGLVPAWAKDLSVGNRMINARSETVAEKPAFRRALVKRRCLVPADGFYEWRALPGRKRKQPFYIHRPDGEPYAFAGLWEQWRGSVPGADGEQEVTVRSATILTCDANEPMRELHDRMPVILPPDAWATWLSPEEDDAELLGRLLVPAPPQLVSFHPVSTEVNNVRNRGDHLVRAVDPDAAADAEVAGASTTPPDPPAAQLPL
jgi:putative SOS response-associated peptidase YedK